MPTKSISYTFFAILSATLTVLAYASEEILMQLSTESKTFTNGGDSRYWDQLEGYSKQNVTTVEMCNNPVPMPQEQC